MNKPIYVLNGPNLNRLGRRQPEIYGHTTLSEIETLCRATLPNRAIVFRQSNREYELIEWIHEAIDEGAGILINPAGFTFTSVAIMDALKMFEGPIFEFHISNVHKREAIYQKSLMSPVVTAVLAGLGARGYAAALVAMDEMLGGA